MSFNPVVTLVDNAGLPIGSAAGFPTSPQAALTIYGPPAQTLTTSGTSPNLSVTGVQALFLSVVVAGATGTTPSLAVAYDQQDAQGNWITAVASLTALTTAGQKSISFGSGIAGATNSVLLTGIGRVTWTITGTTPSFTGVAISVVGR